MFFAHSQHILYSDADHVLKHAVVFYTDGLFLYSPCISLHYGSQVAET